MIKGLGQEKGFQTFIATMVFVINFVIVTYAISLLGEKNSAGNFAFTATHFSLNYYLLLALSLVFGLSSMKLIRYREVQSRWGARLFCSLMMPAFLLLFTLNARIFSWDDLLAKVF